jgi:hypothetical protein
MTPQQEAEKRWLLARLRSVRAGILLVVAEIDEIGISLKNDYITPEHAAHDLTCLETLPVYFAAHIFTPSDATEQSEAA